MANSKSVLILVLMEDTLGDVDAIISILGNKS